MHKGKKHAKSSYQPIKDKNGKVILTSEQARNIDEDFPSKEKDLKPSAADIKKAKIANDKMKMLKEKAKAAKAAKAAKPKSPLKQTKEQSVGFGTAEYVGAVLPSLSLLNSKKGKQTSNKNYDRENRHLTDKDIDRKIKKAGKKLNKMNSSNSDAKNERKLNAAVKALNQAEGGMNKQKKSVSKKEFGDNMFTTPVTRSPLGMMKNASPFQMSCWKGYEAQGQKPSPSGKKTSGGQVKMVNNCVKK